MPKLSPAAQAVWEAFNEDEAGVFVDYGEKLAAALRAAADQVVPYFDEPDWGFCDEMGCDIELYTDHMRKRSQLLAIAAELKGNSNV